MQVKVLALETECRRKCEEIAGSLEDWKKNIYSLILSKLAGFLEGVKSINDGNIESCLQKVQDLAKRANKREDRIRGLLGLPDDSVTDTVVPHPVRKHRVRLIREA
jgi:hypothetical protein